MSALMNQYKAIKPKYPDAILLFRVGDFYETFHDDANTIARCLQIPLTACTSSEIKAVAGFPFHALDVHLRTLVRAGYRVAICEELEDPKKNKGKPKRGVTDSFNP